MTAEKIRSILRKISSGKLTVETGLEQLRALTFEDIGFAKIDHGRSARTGAPEVVFAPGKSQKHILAIFDTMRRAGSDVLITRAEKPIYDAIKKKHRNVSYNSTARMIIAVNKPATRKMSGVIAVLSGGTSDIPVAEEAAATIEAFGARAERIFDVGVAGIHRLLAFKDKLLESSVVIVVAGMEGALPSVVGGLVAAPVIAVPTSIGYGASFEGIAPLLAMLNSCAPGVTVVNIDNGFGAAMAALKILGR